MLLELIDPTQLVAALFIVGLPLAAIYSILGVIGWTSKKGRMSDSFIIWIVWWLSGLTAVGVSLTVLEFDRWFKYFGSLFLGLASVVALVVSLESVLFAMRRLSSPRDETISEEAFPPAKGTILVGLKSAALVTGGATLALVIVIATTVVIDAGYTYFFPRKEKGPFSNLGPGKL